MGCILFLTWSHPIIVHFCWICHKVQQFKGSLGVYKKQESWNYYPELCPEQCIGLALCLLLLSELELLFAQSFQIIYISGPASSWFLLFLIMWSRSKVQNLMWKQKWIHYDFSLLSAAVHETHFSVHIEHRAVVWSRWNTVGILRYSIWPITSQRIPQKKISHVHSTWKKDELVHRVQAAQNMLFREPSGWHWIHFIFNSVGLQGNPYNLSSLFFSTLWGSVGMSIK